MQRRGLQQSRLSSRRPLAAASAALCTTVCLLTVTAARADVTLSYLESNDAGNTGAQAFEVNIKAPKMRMNEQGGMWMLYDSSIDTLFAVDPSRQKYTRINRERAAMMGGMVSAAQAKMKEMMKNMSPQQRAMMEQAMGGMMPAEAPESTYRETGETRTIDRKKCRVGQLLVNDKMEHEFCVAAPKVVGVPPEDYAVMNKMFALMSALREVAGQFIGRSMPDPKDLNGVVIQSRSNNGEHHVLDDVSHKKLDAALFELPEGYQEEAIPTAP